MKRLFIFLFALALVFQACKNRHYYEQTITVPDAVWHYDSMVRFIVPIDDSMAFYRLSLKIEHADAYPYKNIWLRIILKCPCGAVKIDTVNYVMTDGQNRWVGTAIGKNWTVVLPFQDSVRFPSTGNFEFYIGHIMRKNNIPHIKKIGLIVDKLQTKQQKN